MPWYVIRQHQHWRAAVPDEVTRHAVQEIGLHCVQVVQVFLDRLHRYVGPSLHEVGHPVLLAMAVHDGRVFRPMADALAEHGGDDPVGGPLQQLPGKAAADAVAHIEEFRGPEGVHQPTSWSSANASHGLSTCTGPLDSPPLALRWSIVMQRKSFLNSSIALITAVGQLLTRELRPPPGAPSSGKPEPASS